MQPTITTGSPTSFKDTLDSPRWELGQKIWKAALDEVTKTVSISADAKFTLARQIRQHVFQAISDGETKEKKLLAETIKKFEIKN